MLEFLKSWGSLLSMSATGILAFVASPAAVLGTPARKLAGKRSPAAPARAIAIPNAPMASPIHWARVAAVIDQASKAAGIAAEMQSKALVQLEAAEFAIDRILEEVAMVMAPTPEMAAIKGRTAHARA